jgi:hypothetical protein
MLPDVETVRRLADMESHLAEMTRELADFLDQRCDARCEFLYQAEDAMLASAELLSKPDFQAATTKEKDAVAYLIKARDRVRQILGKADQATRQAFRSFDRAQAQKLRRPETEEEKKEKLASKLRDLADKEEIVYATLSGIKMAELSPRSDDDRRQQHNQPQQQGKPSPSQQQSQATPSDQQKPSSQTQGSGGGQKAQTDRQPPAEQRAAQEKGPTEEQISDAPQATDDRQRQEAQDQQGTQGQGKDQEPGRMDRQELERLQDEIVSEAYAVQQVMEALDDLTTLARSRMDGSTKKAEQASDALARGNSDEAAEAANEAGRGFRQLAEHVEGLLAGETSQRVAAARDLANRLAQRERRLSDAVPRPGQPSPTAKSSSEGKQHGQSDPSESGAAAERESADGKTEGAGEPGPAESTPSQPGGAGEHETRDSDQSSRGGPNGQQEPGRSRAGGVRGADPEDLADRARAITESARTLEDLLAALARVEADGDSDAIEEIRRILDQGEVRSTIEQLQRLESLLYQRVLVEARREGIQVAEYLEALGLRLDTLHRMIVAPQIEELMALEDRVSDLRARLAKLESEVQIDGWHFDAEAALRDLDNGSLADDAVDGLVDAMREAGWGGLVDGRWHWRRIGPFYLAPLDYTTHLDVIVQELQAQVHELLLRDLIASGDEATPPEYEEFVNRYFEVLSERTVSKD